MPNSLKQYHPVKTVLAILCMLLFFVCLGLLAWSADRGAAVNGPVHVAADAARVAVTLNDEILVLDTQGALQERHSLATLGIPAYPIDLRWQDDGSLLVATQQPAGIYLCELTQRPCRSLESPLLERLRSQIKVLPAPSGDGFFISDTARGELHWLSANGRDSRLLTGQKLLNRVNDIAVDNEQRLWVADSGNRRIVILQADDNGEWHISDALNAAAEPARPGVDWPMMLAFAADGSAWVTQPDPVGEQADLLIYASPLGIKARVDLSAGAYPTDIARSGSNMLVTDRVNFGLLRIDTTTREVSRFGDRRVQAIFDAAAATRAAADRTMDFSLVGMVLFGVLMIALAVWATPRGRRFTPNPGAPILEPVEPQSGTAARPGHLHWLVPNAGTEKFITMAQRMLLVTTTCLLALLVYAWYLLNGLLDEQATQQTAGCVTGISDILAALSVLGLGVPLLGYIAFRPLRNRLGSDGHFLHIKLHDGRRLTLDPAKLVYSSRILAYENHLLPVQTGNRKPLYAEGEIESHVAPLLSRATRLGPFAMLRYQFRHREPATTLSVLYIAVISVFLWYTGAWRFLA